MNNNHVMPGVAAIVLALLFPLYWLSVLVLGVADMDFADALRNDMLTLSWMDALFLVIGLLEIYIYISLSNAFKERLHSNAARILLYVIIGSVVIFHGFVLADVYLAFNQESMSGTTVDSVLSVSIYSSVAALVVYTVAGIALSIVLLMKSELNAPLIKYFAVLLLIMCILQATIIFALVNILLFPVALIILALFFFKDPEMLEVV